MPLIYRRLGFEFHYKWIGQFCPKNHRLGWWLHRRLSRGLGYGRFNEIHGKHCRLICHIENDKFNRLLRLLSFWLCYRFWVTYLNCFLEEPMAILYITYDPTKYSFNSCLKNTVIIAQILVLQTLPFRSVLRRH